LNLSDYIYKRKSTRRFSHDPLDGGVISGIEGFLSDLTPLDKGIPVKYELIHSIRGGIMRAPHYIAVYSEKKDGYLTNIGFMFQQFDLYLSSQGLGSCWVGLGKPKYDPHPGLEFIILMAFGTPLDPVHRGGDGFRRKRLAEISNISDPRLACARIAPSAFNSQPWYFVDDNDKIYVYCHKAKGLKAIMLNPVNPINVGIAVSHIYLENKDSFSFTKEGEHPILSKYSYIGTIKI